MNRPWVETINFRKFRGRDDGYWIYLNQRTIGHYRVTERRGLRTYDVMWDYAAIENAFGLRTTVFEGDPVRLYLPRLYALRQRPDWWMVMNAFIDQGFVKRLDFI